ncbi:MAG: MFS transporter, partial [Novosphingobium sp.]
MYFQEIRLNWHVLLSGAFGIALGSSLSHYTLSLFGPPLIKDLGWSRSEFALVGSIPLATLLLIPFAGRFVDRFGTKVAAIIGFTAVPLGFVAMSLMSGNLIEYFAIYLAQHVFGILTTSLVFCRVVVERFDVARGIALSATMSAPPLAGALAAPFLGGIIAEDGWRMGYLALAAITASGGLIAILLMGRNRRRQPAAETAPSDSGLLDSGLLDSGPVDSGPAKTALPAATVTLSRAEFFAMWRNPMLLLVVTGMMLVNLPQAFASSQLKLVALANGVSDGSATAMVSLYAIGVIVGRFASGIALDSKVGPHIVAIVALGLPAVGYLLFASSVTALPLLMGGVILIG